MNQDSYQIMQCNSWKKQIHVKDWKLFLLRVEMLVTQFFLSERNLLDFKQDGDRLKKHHAYMMIGVSFDNPLTLLKHNLHHNPGDILSATSPQPQ